MAILAKDITEERYVVVITHWPRSFGEDNTPAPVKQECTGRPKTVAAFLRGVADELDPPKPATRTRGYDD